MSRPDRFSELDIRRDSPTRLYKFGRVALSLTYDNTVICEFDKPYKQVNHVQVVEENGDTVYIFDDEDLRETLYEDYYPYFVQRYPQPGDMEMYLKWQRGQLDEDAAQLLSDT